MEEDPNEEMNGWGDQDEEEVKKSAFGSFIKPNAKGKP